MKVGQVLFRVSCALVILSGCSMTKYVNPSAGPLATLEFPFVLQEYRAGGIQRVGLADTENSCPALKWYDFKGPASIPTGKQIFVVQGVEGVYSGGCKIAYSFVPEEGGRYVSAYGIEQMRCQVNLFRILPDGSRVGEPSFKQAAKPTCLNF